MRELPIPFAVDMVRAVLCKNHPKTKTRRLRGLKALNDGPHRDSINGVECHDGTWHFYGKHLTVTAPPVFTAKCPYGQAGDRLWVRESWAVAYVKNRKTGAERFPIVYRADFADDYDMFGIPDRRWRPGMFLKRTDSRILLEVVGIRVERLQNISEADAVAEGTPGGHGAIPGYGYSATPVEHYHWLWEHINGRGSWDKNPWVWVVEFKRVLS